MGRGSQGCCEEEGRGLLPSPGVPVTSFSLPRACPPTPTPHPPCQGSGPHQFSGNSPKHLCAQQCPSLWVPEGPHSYQHLGKTQGPRGGWQTPVVGKRGPLQRKPWVGTASVSPVPAVWSPSHAPHSSFHVHVPQDPQVHTPQEVHALCSSHPSQSSAQGSHLCPSGTQASRPARACRASLPVGPACLPPEPLSGQGSEPLLDSGVTVSLQRAMGAPASV